jgi:Fe-S oxidoreductase/FAD/FMN-containing dehydrogenase
MNKLGIKLKNIFGERFSGELKERMIYSHDVASLPGPVEMIVGKTADAVVLPENQEEVVGLLNLARRENVPVTPRGAGTSGYGGVLPIKKGIVVCFSRMRRIISVDIGDMTVTVEPGVVFNQLEKSLRAKGLALPCYPTSAPSATIGGWIAEGGSGIGSYKNNFIADNVVGVKIVNPVGEIIELEGTDLDLVNRTEGITGLIVEATIKVEEAFTEEMVLGSFASLEDLQGAMADFSREKLPLWHVAFTTINFNQAKLKSVYSNAPIPTETVFNKERFLLLAVYRGDKGAKVIGQISKIMTNHGGQIEDEKIAHHEWEERFYPMRLKSLGPSLIPSEAIVPVNSIAKVVSEAEVRLPGIAIEGTLVGPDHVTLLCFLTGDERSAAFTLGFAKSLTLLKIAESHGGLPYSAGLYFADRSATILGEEKLNKIRSYKHRYDPKYLLNPGKVLPEGENPAIIRTAMSAAGSTEPILKILEKFFSKNPSMKDKLPKAIAIAAFTCAQCGYCSEVCTLYEGFGWESASPKGKWYLLKQYIKGKIKLDQKDVDKLLMCTTCKKCDPVCQVNLPIMDLWDRLRTVLTVDKGFGTYPAFEMMGASIETDLNIWAGRRKDRDNWIPKDIPIKKEAPIGYWAGCTASYVESEVAENGVRILHEGGVEFTTLGTDEACCGIPMLVAGKPDTFEIAFRNNLEQLKKRGVKELIISCPGCYVAFTHYYPHWAAKLGIPMDLQFTHITEYTDKMVQEGKLKFTKPINKKLTWHDSCHLGRHGGVYEPPRNVLKAIPGVEYQDTEYNREKGRCCGSVLTRIGAPEVSNKVACHKLQEAVDIKADAVVATCPCCEVQLRVGGAKGGINIPVVDFSSIVVEALGYESKNTDDYMFYMWGVFEKAIEIMSSDGIVAMMGNMMPEIMEAMPSAMKSMIKGMEALPGFIQGVPLAAMEKVIPLMMPAMFPAMMPKLMPRVMELMKEAIPNMPPQMEEKLPTMLPKVMAKIMPGMMAEVAPRLAPKMTEHIRLAKSST